MAELNLVEKANKVISFRKVIREICRKKGLEYPSDDKISEYINQKYGMNVDDFMKDYTEKEGIFRDPTTDFYNDLMKINWGEETPTIENVKEFVAKNGYDKQKFMNEWVINTYKGVEKNTLIATIKLTDEVLVQLWNTFIEESAIYGEDSYIYDLTNEHDIKVLRGCMKPSEWAKVKSLSSRFIQWFDLNGREIEPKKDIKGVIIAYWSEIFKRVMLYPSAYPISTNLYAEGDGSTYFDDVFFPVIAKEIGYIINGDKGIIEKIEK